MALVNERVNERGEEEQEGRTGSWVGWEAIKQIRKEESEKIKAYRKKEIKERDHTHTHGHPPMSHGAHPFLRRPIVTEEVINRIARHHRLLVYVFPNTLSVSIRLTDS